MKTSFVATYWEADNGGCVEPIVIGVFTSHKNAKTGIRKWRQARTSEFRPLHGFHIAEYTPDTIGGLVSKRAINSCLKDEITKPVYHGFPTIPETLTDGWIYGAITDYEKSPDGCDSGDGFVVAPDGSRAGLDWNVGRRKKIRQVAPPNELQWGVYEVCFPRPIRTPTDLVKNFRAVLPQIQKIYSALKSTSPKKNAPRPRKVLKIAPTKPIQGQGAGTATFSPDYAPEKTVFDESEWSTETNL